MAAAGGALSPPVVVDDRPAPGVVRSYASALASSLRPDKVDIAVKPPAFTDDGHIACFFSKEETFRSEAPLHWAVVMRSAHGRPSIPETKSCLSQRLGLNHDFIISVLNPRHILLRFHGEEDFSKVLVRKNLYIKGHFFRFFRWSKSFDFEADPTTIPIWVGFPNLPVNYYSEAYLHSIAGNIGEVLRIHEFTAAWTRTAEALVCIDVDIAGRLHDRIWIGDGADGFWQPIVYYRVPDICSFCRRIGHQSDTCLKKAKMEATISVPVVAPQQHKVPAPAPNKDIDTSQEWREVRRGRRRRANSAGAVATRNAFAGLSIDAEEPLTVTTEAIASPAVASDIETQQVDQEGDADMLSKIRSAAERSHGGEDPAMGDDVSLAVGDVEELLLVAVHGVEEKIESDKVLLYASTSELRLVEATVVSGNWRQDHEEVSPVRVPAIDESPTATTPMTTSSLAALPGLPRLAEDGLMIGGMRK